MSGGMGPRMDSMPMGGLPQGGPAGGRLASGGGRPGQGPGAPLKERPTPLDHDGPGRSSAPPGQVTRPPVTSPTLSTHTTESAPEPKPKPKPSKASQGPATFEQMGIPSAKKEDDCVSPFYIRIYSIPYNSRMFTDPSCPLSRSSCDQRKAPRFRTHRESETLSPSSSVRISGGGFHAVPFFCFGGMGCFLCYKSRLSIPPTSFSSILSLPTNRFSYDTISTSFSGEKEAQL